MRLYGNKRTRPTTSVPPVDTTDREIARTLQSVRQSVALAGIGALGRQVLHGGGQDGSSFPPPATVTDVIALSRESREAAAQQAKAHMEVAEMERKRRIEIEKESSGAYEAGKSDATEMLKMLDERDERARVRQDALEAEVQKTRDEAREASSQMMLAALKDNIDGYRKDIDRLMAEKDRALSDQGTQLKEAKDHLREAEGKEKDLLAAILKGDQGHPLLQLAERLSGRGGASSVDDEWYRTQIAMKRDEHDQTLEDRRMSRETKREVIEMGKKALVVAEKIMGGGGTPGLPKNGVPGTWPEEVSDGPDANA